MRGRFGSGCGAGSLGDLGLGDLGRLAGRESLGSLGDLGSFLGIEAGL